MVKIQIVISRFNEDISWSESFNDKIIYNKGQNNINCNYIPLENVGREGHTYYYHIYNNYDNLSDFTIFLQGYPFDHSPNIINDINSIINNNNYDEDFKNLAIGNHEYSLVENFEYKQIFNNSINIYKKLFKTDNIYPDRFIFGPGAQFIVKKEAILKHPKEFYYEIIKILDYSNDPIEGHSIERMHKLFFTL